jgi:hypothetical protein
MYAGPGSFDDEAVPLDLLTDFLTAAVHLILKCRRVYPPEVFERRRFLDVLVYRSRSRPLTEYISLVVSGARHLLERGEADALIVSLLGAPDASSSSGVQPRVVERFRFEIQQRADLSRRARVDALRAELQGFLLKLSFCEHLLAPLPADVAAGGLSFRLEMHSAPTRSGDPLPPELGVWVECDQRAELGGVTASVVTPLKSMHSDVVSMQLMVQQEGGGQAIGASADGRRS